MTNSIPYVSSELLNKVKTVAAGKYKSANLIGENDDLGMIILQKRKIEYQKRGRKLTYTIRSYVLFDHCLNKIGVVSPEEINGASDDHIPGECVRSSHHVLYMSNQLFSRFTAVAASKFNISRKPFKDIGMLVVENYKVSYRKRGNPVASDKIDFMLRNHNDELIGIVKRSQIKKYYPTQKAKHHE